MKLNRRCGCKTGNSFWSGVCWNNLLDINDDRVICGDRYGICDVNAVDRQVVARTRVCGVTYDDARHDGGSARRRHGVQGRAGRCCRTAV